jgi:hypothetical protein
MDLLEKMVKDILVAEFYKVFLVFQYPLLVVFELSIEPEILVVQF